MQIPAEIQLFPDSSVQIASYFLVSRERVSNFIGREDQLRQILAYFSTPRADQDPAPRVLILNALGGQGKSQIALEYCRRSRKTYQGVFWVHASSEASAIQSYENIMTKLKIGELVKGDAEAVVELVRDFMEHWNERWLLVFDNYDEPEKFHNVRNFIPKGRKLQSQCYKLRIIEYE